MLEERHLQGTTLPTEESTYLEGLNNEQRQAVLAPRTQAVQVLAGAGTGKTKLIAHRFVKLVDELATEVVSTPQDRILAVTFTEDAAEELASRIDRQLKEMGHEGISENTWISTFHTFCLRLLRNHAPLLELTPTFEILDSLRQRQLFESLIEDLKHGVYADIETVLLRYRLTSLSKDVLSLKALKGLEIEGVTELLTRIPKVIQRIKAAGLTPAEFLHLAPAQSRTLTEGLKTLPMQDPLTREPFGEARSYCIAWHQHLAPWATPGWNPLAIESKKADPSPGDYLKQVEFLKKPLDLLYFDRKAKAYLPKATDCRTLDALTGYEERLCEIIAAVYAVYLEALRAQNRVDFDGLIHGAIALLSNHPEIRQQYQQQFEALIVDEFQDSNGSELKLLQLLMRDEHPNITVVGDEKQSIYGFRFAQRENMDLIFQHHPCQPIQLHQNYRSAPPILTVANAFAKSFVSESQHITLTPGKPSETATPKAVQWISLGGLADPDDEANTPVKEPIEALRRREARLIAVEIARLATQEGIPFGQIAILVKQHQKTALLQEALQALGIPSVRKKNVGFFQEPVIKTALALLRLVGNLNDDASLVRVLQTRLNQRQLLELSQLRSVQKGHLFDVLQALSSSEGNTEGKAALTPTVRTALENLTEELQELHRERNRQEPMATFDRLARRIGFILPQEPEALRETQGRQLRMLEKLLEELTGSLPVPVTFDALLKRLEEAQSDPDLSLPPAAGAFQAEAVQMMTIHGSKGLEYPVVFVAYTEDGKLPKLDDSRLLFDPQFEGKAGFGLIYGGSAGQTAVKKEVYRKVWHQPRLEEEAKRLFYVALTRAQERLYVIRADQSFSWTAADTLGDLGESLQIFNEHENPTYFEETYWKADTQTLREQVLAPKL